MRALNRLIDKIGVDKLLHFAFGGWIASKFMETGIPIVGVSGILFIAFIGIVKEYIFDKESGAGWKDIAATMIGGLVEFVSYYLIVYII